MPIKIKRRKLTVLHAGTVSQPIRSDFGYGPIETIVHNIDQGLHSLGQRSIVACSGDSKVAGEHFVTVDQCIGPYWGTPAAERQTATNIHLLKVLDRVMEGDIDIIHTHDTNTVDFLYDSLSDKDIQIVMTLHVAPHEDLREEAYQRWCGPLSSPQVHSVAISEHQKKQYYGFVNAENVVHHGIDVNEYPIKAKRDKDSYLFSIGRITPDKGQDKAIEIAKKTGAKLIIAGCVQDKAVDKQFFASLKNDIGLVADVGKHEVNNDYHDKVIKPLLNRDEQIIYIGELGGEQKKEWFQYARATLFPIQWGEPFGLVMIESMACGTPVMALNRGAVPEIIVDGKTGFVADSIDGLLEAFFRIDSIDPVDCRQHVKSHFSEVSMAKGYLNLYRQIVRNKKTLQLSGDNLTHVSLPALVGNGALVAR